MWSKNMTFVTADALYVLVYYKGVDVYFLEPRHTIQHTVSLCFVLFEELQDSMQLNVVHALKNVLTRDFKEGRKLCPSLM